MELRNSSVQHFVVEEDGEGCLRLRERRADFEAPDDREPPETRVALAILPALGIGDALRGGEREPNVVIAAGSDSGEARLSDAYDGEGDVIEFDGAADDVARAAEGALPVTVIEDGDGRGGRSVVARLQHAAGGGWHAHGAEKITRDDLAADDAGGAVAGEVEAAGVGERGDSGEGVGLGDGAKHWLGEGAAGGIGDAGREIRGAITGGHVTVNIGSVARVPAEDDELLGIFDGQGAEHHGVNQAEDSGIGSDAERESENDDDGEAGREAQHAQAVADVLHEAF